ncbi:MAG: SdrD B-like domain-containing protein [Eisenbergiella massiliensis]
MATISGRVIFDRDRSLTVSTGDSGIAGIPVVLQNTATGVRLTVLTDANGNYSFINVPNGNYRIVEAYGTPGGVASPGNFADAQAGSIPVGTNPPIGAVTNPPAGSTNLDSLTPDTLFVTVAGADIGNQNFFNGPVIYTPIEAILDECAVISGENLIDAADGVPLSRRARRQIRVRPQSHIQASPRISHMFCLIRKTIRRLAESIRCRIS